MIILTIAWKDLRLIVRDRGALLFTLLVPVVVITIVAESLSGGDASPSILLPVVNEDEGPVAEVLIESLSSHLEVVVVERAHAEKMVGEEKAAAAALVMPERLSKRYLASRPSTLTLLTDPAKGSELATIRAIFLLADRDAQLLADPFSEVLLTLEEESLTGSRLTTTSLEQNIPGFSLMFVLMASLFGVAFALDDERSFGTLTRFRAAPIHPFSLLGGKLLARYVIGVMQMLLLFAFGRVAFGLPLGPSMATFVLVTLSVVFGITGFSLLVATFARSREQIIPLGLTVVMIVCSIGGCWWPLYQEPRWLQDLARLFVTAWAMEGLQDLILRERTLVDVWPTLLALLGYGVACLMLGAGLRRRD